MAKRKSDQLPDPIADRERLLNEAAARNTALKLPEVKGKPPANKKGKKSTVKPKQPKSVTDSGDKKVTPGRRSPGRSKGESWRMSDESLARRRANVAERDKLAKSMRASGASADEVHKAVFEKGKEQDRRKRAAKKQPKPLKRNPTTGAPRRGTSMATAKANKTPTTKVGKTTRKLSTNPRQVARRAARGFPNGR